VPVGGGVPGVADSVGVAVAEGIMTPAPIRKFIVFPAALISDTISPDAPSHHQFEPGFVVSEKPCALAEVHTSDAAPEFVLFSR
jgi:hypothetical protein